MMEMITAGLQDVTVNVPDFQTLEVIRAVRRLYVPQKEALSPNQIAELMRRFIKGYASFKDDPEVQTLIADIGCYNEKLEQLGVRDHEIPKIIGINGWYAITLLIFRIIYLALSLIFVIPGLVINFPVILVAKWKSKKMAEEAVKNSNVKIKGKDVLATWKVLVGIVVIPLLYLFYSIVLAIGLSMTNEPSWIKWILPFLLFIAILPLVSFFAIRFGEVGYEYLLSLIPLLTALFSSFGCQKNQIGELQMLRHELSERIRALVDRLGPSVIENFDQVRVVSPNKFEIKINE